VPIAPVLEVVPKSQARILVNALTFAHFIGDWLRDYFDPRLRQIR